MKSEEFKRTEAFKGEVLPKKLKGAIFDMDRTLVDVPYDWKKIKEELKDFENFYREL